MGLDYFPNGDASPAACAAACCPDLDCRVWQWSKASQPCWGGLPSSRCLPGAGGFTGAARAPVPGDEVPVPATTGFDDSGWDLVDTPHDFVIDGEVECVLAPPSQDRELWKRLIAVTPPITPASEV